MVQCDFFYNRRGDERVFFCRSQKYRLEFRHQAAVHVGQLELEFKVRYGSQSTYQDIGLVFFGKINQQPGKANNLDIGKVLGNTLGQLNSLLEIEQGLFARLKAIPTTTWSNIAAARSMRSRCPLVMGSKVPG